MQINLQFLVPLFFTLFVVYTDQFEIPKVFLLFLEESVFTDISNFDFYVDI